MLPSAPGPSRPAPSPQGPSAPPVSICPTLPVTAVTPSECFVGQYNPFGLFVLEHYLRCRERLWNGLDPESLRSTTFPSDPADSNYFWGYLHERCSSVWSLIGPEERIRFVGLSFTLRLLDGHARSANKRLVAALREDRLLIELEDAGGGRKDDSRYLIEPLTPLTCTKETKDVSTMTDPCIVLDWNGNVEKRSVKVSQKTGLPYKKRGRKANGVIKAARTPYMMFVAKESAKIQRELENKTEKGGLFKELGRLWNGMSKEDRTAYHMLAKEDKVRYDREMVEFGQQEKPTASQQPNGC